jgi:PAS domain S-box-containing protein
MFTEANTEVLLAASRDAILILDSDLTIRKANPVFCRNFGFDPKGIEGKSLYEIDGNAWDNPAIHYLFNELLPNEKQAEDYEIGLDFHKNGFRDLVINAQQAGTDPDSMLIFLVVEDITEKKKAQLLQTGIEAELEMLVKLRTAELEQSRSFLNSVLGSTYYGIASYEPVRNDAGEITDFRIVYTNQEVPGNFGLSVHDVVGKTFTEVYPGIFENGIFEKVRNCLITGMPNTYEISVNDGGNELWLTAAMEKVNDTVTITSKNITPEKSAALQLERMNTLLSNKNKELSSFTYIASHDLQEPLRKIRMFISRILEEEKHFSDNALSHFTNINATAVRMQMLIDALLSYSSMDSDAFKTERTDLNKFMKEVLSLIDISIEDSSAVFHIDSLPSVQVVRIQFQQLLLNIINNAIKYRKPGIAPIIKISAEKIENEQRKFWKLIIEDNGIGFDPQYGEKIFEVFQRLHGKTEYEGTGVGLAICKKIMQNHHGDITAEGNPGIGAKFNIFIPAKS